MAHRRIQAGLAVAVGLIVMTLGRPGAAAGAAESGSTAAVTSAWTDSGTTDSCPRSVHLFRPKRSPQYYAAHPDALAAPRSVVTPQLHESLDAVAAAKIHYLPTLNCRAGRAQPALTSAAASGQSSAIADSNWAGYLDKSTSGGTNYLATAMQWRVPAVSAPAYASSYSSIWPGIGSGTSSTDQLIQAGTEQDSICAPGGCQSHIDAYYFWFEIVPQQGEQIITNLIARPGDQVSAIVQYEPTSRVAYFQLVNLTTHQGVYLSQALTGPWTRSGGQGEWIVERTEVGSTLPRLANFGTQTITRATAVVGAGWNSSSYLYANTTWLHPTAMNMQTSCSGVRDLARTSPFAANGQFSVTWQNYGTPARFGSC
jgi:hypothetical protein